MIGMRWTWTLIVGVVTVLVATAGLAIEPPQSDGLRQKELRHPDLDYLSVYRPVGALPAELSRELAGELAALGVDPGNAYFDLRTGRWGTLVLTRPLIPGTGIGNDLEWSALGYESAPEGAALERPAWTAFRQYLAGHAAELGIDPSKLAKPRVSALSGGRLIQIHVDRVHDGLPVRNTYLKAAINSGNLVLHGERNWADIELETRPGIGSAEAAAILRQHVELAETRFRAEPSLEILPVSSQREETLEMLGDGLEHRLVWVLTPEYEADSGTWEALVDAHSGALLAFEDQNHYASRRVEGAIFPVSNDGLGDDGTLQFGYPMPFADIALDGSDVGFSTVGGNVPSGADPGTLSTTLSGQFINISDNCGGIDESVDAGDLDLDGVPPPGTDCDIPTGHSPGDSNAARTGFYELNRLVEQARGYLPSNTWLSDQLTANMNINQNCNAFWSTGAGTVNFYTSGGGCANTGEIAAIFDHEWGHGWDANNVDPGVSSPGEGIADIVALNRLNDSCVGRGFRPASNCTGFGDACLECTGVRESDWAKQASGEPHDVTWILQNTTGPGGGCVGTQGSTPPCISSTHCQGSVIAEAAWDLVHRDLMGFESSPFDFDLNTALELGTRLAYDGANNVGLWFQCEDDGTAGCNADSGYLGYIAADDDDGDLTNGTPHMSAIFAAFDRHQLACPTPTVNDSGCAGAPATAPANLSSTTFNEGAELTWDAVTGAEEYWIYRTEGVHGCDFGKARVGVTSGTEFLETGLGNDFEVLYSVVAVGDNDACTSPMSACAAATPVPGPGFTFQVAPLVWQEQTGDGDVFFDNCETGTLSFEIFNTGVGALTDVRIVEATVVSHPEAEIQTSLPAVITASLAEGATASGELTVLGGGFAFNDTLELRVAVTSDELDPLALPKTYTLTALEGDLKQEPSVTFSFEDGDDAWQLVSGVFDRTDAGDGGADETAFYRASSTDRNLNCDRIRSPLLQLSAISTLEVYNQFDIEGFNQFWWDRANVGVYDLATDERTVVSPDGGRTYNASGTNPAPAPCASDSPPGQPGWAGFGPGWEPSTWSADALGAPDLTDRLIQLDVAYGTDPEATGNFGLWFDEVTVTDLLVQSPDAQPDVCGVVPQPDFEAAGLRVDSTATVVSDGNGVFEPGELVVVAPEWRNDGLVSGALTGDAFEFTGPAGATYTLLEDSADYGHVAAGEMASCVDGAGCYEMSLGDPAVRPATLWEATFDETLDDSEGTTKTWRLHIGDSFTDVPRASIFYTGIESLLHSGVTGGCGDGSEYCPADANTRGQIPAFMLRALMGPEYTPPSCEEGQERLFADVPTSNIFCPWIEDLAGRGIVSGCGDDNYCPSAAVTRAQMAIFLLKTLEGSDYTPMECDGQFDDVTCPSLFADWIEDLAARGITGGCSANEYCPTDIVTRGQMAAFITKTFGFTLYGP